MTFYEDSYVVIWEMMIIVLCCTYYIYMDMPVHSYFEKYTSVINVFKLLSSIVTTQSGFLENIIASCVIISIFHTNMKGIVYPYHS